MNLEKEVQLLREENRRLKDEIVEYMETVYELKKIIANHKVGRTKTITSDIENRIIELRLEGYTMREIGVIVERSYGSVHSVLKKHNIKKFKNAKQKESNI